MRGRWKLLTLCALCLCWAALWGAPALGEPLRVDFYDMGKADAMLITAPNGQRVLIDAGTNDGGKALAKRLEAEGVTRIDVMLITHYDKDHVGGADKILERFAVGTVIAPSYAKESKQYTQFTEALAASPATTALWLTAREHTALALGDAQMTIRAAEQTDYGADEENDFSLATWLQYGQVTCLFTGDAEEARQTELLAGGDLACDILKVPYHGRWLSTSAAFLSACRPKLAFITDSEKEPADERTLAQLEALGAAVHCAKDGGITAYTDGQTVWAEAME